MKHDNDFEPIGIPIDGILDLHTFNPKDIKELLPAYISECRSWGILDVRIIHGKGTGTLRETVHSMLRRIPEVDSFSIAGGEGGGWGATIVRLAPKTPGNEA